MHTIKFYTSSLLTPDQAMGEHSVAAHASSLLTKMALLGP